MENTQPDFSEARRLFEIGLSPRRIAAVLDILPSRIKTEALRQNWRAGPQANWDIIREHFEQGKTPVELAKLYDVSLNTLRHKARRENWSRFQLRGLEALRRAVFALENALVAAPNDDPNLTTRISTALSMAAARLSRAEQIGKNNEPLPEPEETNLDPEDELAVSEFGRVLKEWRSE